MGIIFLIDQSVCVNNIHVKFGSEGAGLSLDIDEYSIQSVINLGSIYMFL